MLYKDLAELIKKTEGEAIQDLYFLFKTWPLDPETCETFEGELIPTLEDIEEMQAAVKELFEKRHEDHIKNNLYAK